MRYLRLIPFVAFAAVAIAIGVTAVRSEDAHGYRSPCRISWEWDGRTYCEMTPQAAREERMTDR